MGSYLVLVGDIRVTAVFESITYTGIVGKEIKKMKSVISEYCTDESTH